MNAVDSGPALPVPRPAPPRPAPPRRPLRALGEARPRPQPARAARSLKGAAPLAPLLSAPLLARQAGRRGGSGCARGVHEPPGGPGSLRRDSRPPPLVSRPSRGRMPDQISVSEFIAETTEDYNSPTTSSFTTRLHNCRNTVTLLEEVGGGLATGWAGALGSLGTRGATPPPAAPGPCDPGWPPFPRSCRLESWGTEVGKD